MKLKCAFFVAIALAGCSHTEPNPVKGPADPVDPKANPASSNPLVGKWVVDPEFISSHKDADKGGFLTGLAKTFWFEFNADKSFTAAATEGTYVYAEGVVNLLTTSMGGKRLEQDGKPAAVSMPGELSKDGTKLTLHPQQTELLPASIQTGIVLTKSKA